MTTLFSDYLKKNPSIFSLENSWMTFDNLMQLILLTNYSTTAYEKSASEAVKLRNLGNEKYQSKNYEEALRCYSGSIATAPVDSVELALAFGNRSAVLFVLRKYELCLLDVNRALKARIPEYSKAKLLERKTSCWKRLEEENEFKSLNLRVSLLRYNRFSIKVLRRSSI